MFLCFSSLQFNCQMPTEDSDRFSRRPNDSSSEANSKLVPQTSSHVSGFPTSATTTSDCLSNARDGMGDSPLNQENGSDCLQIVRQSYETRIFSKGKLYYLTVLEKRNY